MDRPRRDIRHGAERDHAALTVRDLANLMVRNSQGGMVPLGTVANITPAVGPSLISLYNLYPSATVIGLPATGYSSGQSMTLMEEIAAKTLPPGTGYEWTAMSYQEKVVGGQIYLAFGLALLLVYLVLAGQYGSWYAPISVILAVPLSLLGPMAVLTSLRIEQPLHPDRDHPADRFVGQERHPDRRGGAGSCMCVNASRCWNPRSRWSARFSARS